MSEHHCDHISKDAGAASAPRHAKREEGSQKNPWPAKKKRQVAVLFTLLAILLVVAAAGIGFMVWQQQELDRAAQQAQDVPEAQGSSSPAQEQSGEGNLPENPVDFVELKTKNPDIYAWVSIPGTKVDVPILQSTVDDNFYLDHNADGDYAIEGAAYTQRANATDFSDPVTMVYGHQVQNGSMFTTLHYFEDKTFFDEHDVMYIYTPRHILTYRIVAAYQYDDRHVLNSFDFSKPEVVREYFDSVLSPASMLVNVRDGVVLADDDKIVQLSTCMDAVNRDHTRYLVTGVLIDEQQTQ